MPVALVKLGGVMGSLIIGMFQTLLTKHMMKFVILKLMDYAISKYEKSAMKSESKDDDKVAEVIREVFEKLSNEWK